MKKNGLTTKEEVYEALDNVFDPEIHMPVTDLGLIYNVAIAKDKIEIDFTLTYPGCPLADVIEADIITEVVRVSHTVNVKPKLVWTPVWSPERMSEEARLAMGFAI